MARYVDGFVLPVPTKNLAKYKKMASEAGKMWMRHGALQYIEAAGNDLNPKGGMKIVKFPELAKTKPGETVIFAFIMYRSKKHRDQVNAKVMKDPVMNDLQNKNMEMPFDVKRMAYGGFSALVDHKR